MTQTHPRLTIVLAVTLLLLSVALLTHSALTQSAAASPAMQSEGLYSYSVKFVCGKHSPDGEEPGIVRPGMYATEINIHNPQSEVADIRKHFIILVEDGRAIGREPEQQKLSGSDWIALRPGHATLDDCRRIREIAGVDTSVLTIGFVELVSPIELSVDAVYTTGDFDGRFAPGIDVERVEAKRVR